MGKETAKNIFEDIVVRKGNDLYLEDKMYQGGKEVTGRPYKVYTALVAQVSNNPPTVTVIENTLGEVPSFSYSGATGIMTIATVADIFIEGKTFWFISNTYTSGRFHSMVRSTSKSFSVKQWLSSSISTDDHNYNIEIRVYL